MNKRLKYSGTDKMRDQTGDEPVRVILGIR